MKHERFQIHTIPAVLYGEPAEKGYLFLHGQMGRKEEAEAFAQVACPKGYQVLAIDLPGHGERQDRGEELLPWIAVEEIRAALDWAKCRWKTVSLRATSMGVYLALVAFEAPERALLVSPIIYMDEQIRYMLHEVGATEEQLRQRGEIPGPGGHKLSWDYLRWVKEHPIHRWSCPVRILCGKEDTVMSRSSLDFFIHYCGAWLTLVEGAQHWLHTPWELSVLRGWEERSL